MGRIFQRAIFGDPPFIVVLWALSIFALQSVCDSWFAPFSQCRRKLLVVKSSNKRMPDFVRRSYDLNLDAEIISHILWPLSNTE